MKNYYETIIVGAGPAGLIAGRYLKDALILEQKKEIGRPVQCGEGISCMALKMQNIEPDPSWISCKINTVQRITPNNKIIGRKHTEILGYIINREIFEKYLASTSRAEIKLNTRIIDFKKEGDFWNVIAENNESFRAKYLIGADGPHSMVRQKIFQEEVEFIPALNYLIKTEKDIDTETIKIYLDNENFPGGYAWIFPKSKNTANIGLGGGGDLTEKFKDFTEKIIKKEYGNYQILENKSGVIPNKKGCAKFFKDNAFLVGDAAGFADPIFKGGVNQAMFSGKIAAERIIKNEANLYDKKINSMSFANQELTEAKEIFYSFDNMVLNELGTILEGKGLSHLKTFSGIIKLLSKPKLWKNLFNILKFFSIWQRKRDYLW